MFVIFPAGLVAMHPLNTAGFRCGKSVINCGLMDRRPLSDCVAASKLQFILVQSYIAAYFLFVHCNAKQGRIKFRPCLGSEKIFQ